MLNVKTTLVALSVALAAVTSADAATVKFGGKATGAQEVPGVDTDATGKARLKLKTRNEKLTFKFKAKGIFVDDLMDVGGLGPVHLHNAAAGANGGVVVPFAFDVATYSDTAKGFKLKLKKIAFDDINIVPRLSFIDFVDELKSGNIYANVHTASFGSGEIRAQLAKRKSPKRAARRDPVIPAVLPVPIPASGLLLLGVFAGLAGLRSRQTRQL